MSSVGSLSADQYLLAYSALAPAILGMSIWLWLLQHFTSVHTAGFAVKIRLITARLRLMVSNFEQRDEACLGEVTPSTALAVGIRSCL